MRAMFGAVLALGTGSLGQGLALRAQEAPQPGQKPYKETNIAAGKFTLGAPLPAWAETAELPAASPGEPVTMRVADTQYYLGAAPITFVRRAMTVNDASALASIGQVPIPFVPDYERLTLHSVRVLRGADVLDRTQSSSIRFLERETGLENGVYSGEVTASILVNDLRVGDTLDYAYSIEGQNPVFAGKFLATTSWDAPYTTGLRRVVLNAPEGRPIQWRLNRAEGAAAPTPRETIDGGMRKLVFEERALPGLPPESGAAPDDMLFRSIQFSEFSDWADVVRWASTVFQVDNRIDGDLRAVLDTLRAKPTEEERIVATLEFVQSEIRYFSVSLGESSHRPAAPSTVFQRRYGDCKDKSMLLIALLKELGVAARPVLLSPGTGRLVRKLLPSANVFNHVIVEVTTGGRAYHLDPTRLAQHGRLNRMGQSHEGTDALRIAAEGGELFTIASANAADLGGSDLSEVATLPKLGGAAEIEVRQRWVGVGAEAMRVVRASTPPEYFARSVTSMMEMRYPGTTLIGEPKAEDDRVENTYTLTTRFQVPNLASEKDGNWFVRFAPSNMRGLLPSPPSTTRRTAFALPFYPYAGKYSFEARFPETVSAMRDPVATTVEDKHFTFTSTNSFRGNVAKVSAEVKIVADRVAVPDLAAYIAKKATLGETISGIVVGKADIGGDITAALASFEDKMRARIQEGIDKTTETIKGGKLKGEDLAYAHARRSLAFSYLGRAAEALEDANAAIKMAPNASNGYSSRGFANLVTGALAKSIGDYNNAISLSGETVEADDFRGRGKARFYLGRLEEAAEDFAKAAEASDAEGRLYNALWQSWTLRRLGKPLPEAIATQAAAEAAGEWPRPALAMLAGALSPEQVLQGIEAKAGDEKHMALAEAYFYVGQYYFAAGDKDKARDYFQKTRAMGVLPYTEHIAAGLELRLMGAPR